MVNKPLKRPAIYWGGWHWGGTLGSHDKITSTKVIKPFPLDLSQNEH